VHVFSVEGKQHPDIGEIYFELYQFVSEMRKWAMCLILVASFTMLGRERRKNC